jgi:hypothetical protein
MRLSCLFEERQQIHLFHGTLEENIPSILKHGLNQGDGNRAFFAPLRGAYHQKGSWGLIEAVVNPRHSDLASSYSIDDFLYRNGPLPSDHPEFVAAMHRFREKFRDMDVEKMMSTPELSKEYWRGAAAFTRRTKEVDNFADRPANYEVNLPLPVGFTGSPRIVGVYSVEGKPGQVTKVWYSRGGTLQVGSAVG